MYKILLADDEGIVISALTFIIEQAFPGKCEIRSVSTGRALVEAAEEYRPDIAFVDIQMPGINGIDAMRKIRERHIDTAFIILSAFNDFDYAKEAVSIGALAYLNKPIDREQVVGILDEALRKLKDARSKKQSELETKEKLELAAPMMENGLIYAMLSHRTAREEIKNYLRLLGIEQTHGNIMILRAEDKQGRDEPTRGEEAEAVLQEQYGRIRQLIRQEFDAYVGSVTGNMLVAYIPCDAMDEEAEYNYRVSQIKKAREIVRMIEEEMPLSVKISFGGYRSVDKSYDGYNEALIAARRSRADVVHINDFPKRHVERSYPLAIEDEMFHYLEEGDTAEMLARADQFFRWMTENHSDDQTDIQLKVLEQVLRGETIGYESGAREYTFTSRTSYISEVTGFTDNEELYAWYRQKLINACEMSAARKSGRNEDIFVLAREYIGTHFKKDISLDDLSRELGVSPYYFSRQFKKQTGQSFVEYLTQVRMEKAKALLRDTDMAMKEIALECGYSDQNYFSRAFKKQTGLTPSDYRDTDKTKPGPPNDIA